MIPQFYRDSELTYIENKFVLENEYKAAKRKEIEIPQFEPVRQNLPKPVWEGHREVEACYDKAWELAFSNLHNPSEKSGFIAPYIDAAFNDCLFMWDSCFMLMFGKYAAGVFDFQQTLNNFYSLQHKDGFIPREIAEEDGSERFSRFDPSSTGPNVMSWCEYEYYKFSGDKKRLKKVFPVLLAYHQWFAENRTWQDGSYWSTGWGCGMDNLPRFSADTKGMPFSTGHMVWVDICFQQILSCDILIKMADVCGRRQDVTALEGEKERLTRIVNEQLWDEETHFYYDLWQNGKLSRIKTVGSYWALLSNAVPMDKLKNFIAHLDNPAEFKRKHRVPALSADCEGYSAAGNYWCGGVWAPTNYMVLKGLAEKNYYHLAYEIASNSLSAVAETFQNTGTYWENYAPDMLCQGKPAKADFVGWSGIFPISMLFEFVFGMEWDGRKNELCWHIHLTDAFGVEGYPLGTAGKANLFCKQRSSTHEKPEITIKSDTDIMVRIFWDNTEEVFEIKAEE